MQKTTNTRAKAVDSAVRIEQARAEKNSSLQSLGEMLSGAAAASSGKGKNKGAAKTVMQAPATKRRNQAGVSGEPTEKNVNLPPAMSMGAKLKLHTHLAINMFRGRRADRAKGIRAIVGVSLFAGLARAIWFASRDDDPYADQCLLDIERIHGEAKAALDNHEQALNNVLEGIDGLDVSIQTSDEPLEIDLNFSSPWSYRAVLLLLQYDRIVRLGLTARHVGFIGDEEWHNVISDSGRHLRNLLGQVDRWIMTGVTRDDVRHNTAIAKRAEAMYAMKRDRPLTLTPEVVEGTKRARISPKNETLEKYLNQKALNASAMGSSSIKNETGAVEKQHVGPEAAESTGTLDE